MELAADSVIADATDERDGTPETRRRNRLVRALAARDAGVVTAQDGLAGHRVPWHWHDDVQVGAADDADIDRGWVHRCAPYRSHPRRLALVESGGCVA